MYISKGKDGKVTYTSRPNHNAKPHELPEIMKGSLKLGNTSKDPPCKNHGGPNCSLGTDSSGSVTCHDGSRDPKALFSYACPTARLEVLSITQKEGVPSALVVVRNSRSVAAIAPAIHIRSKSSQAVQLSGPERLEGQALAVYEVLVPKGVLPGGSQKLLKNHLWITCGNCG